MKQDRKERRREKLTEVVGRLLSGEPFASVHRRGWARYATHLMENPDLAAEIESIRRVRMRPVFKDLPEGCYLIQCETTGLVKIGFSNDPNDRLRTLRIGSPTKLAIRGVLGGGRDMEATLHARFAHRRSHGEWYALTPEEMAETLCGSVVPEPGSYRSAKRAQARFAASAPRPVQERAKTERSRAKNAGRALAPMRHDAHIKSWIQAEAFRVYTQTEIVWLTGWGQGAVSRALSEAGVVAARRYRLDKSEFLARVFNA
jgi:hypothetical protein